MSKRYLILDIEVFPNLFQIGIKEFDSGDYWNFYISNDETFSSEEFKKLDTLLSENTIVTYNGLGFDNHMLSYLLANPKATTSEFYQLTQLIINGVKNVIETITLKITEMIIFLLFIFPP